MEKVLNQMEEEDWKEVSLVLMMGEGNSGIESSTLLAYCKAFQQVVQGMDKEKRVLLCGSKPDASTKPGSAHNQHGLLTLIRELERKQKKHKFPLKYSSISLEEGHATTAGKSNSAQQIQHSPELLACELVKFLQADGFGKEAAISIKDLM